MKRAFREVGFAVLAWLLPLVFAVCIFPLKASHTPLFDTLMSVALTASTVLLGCLYFRRVGDRYLAQGVRIGVQWVFANLLLDSLMFSGGPMKMSLDAYAMDIGLAYLAVPAVTIGLGYAAAEAKQKLAESDHG